MEAGTPSTGDAKNNYNNKCDRVLHAALVGVQPSEALEILNDLLVRQVVAAADILHHKSLPNSLPDSLRSEQDESVTATTSPPPPRPPPQQQQQQQQPQPQQPIIRRTRHIALRLFYDGATYSGLAQNVGQPTDNSIERVLFEALQKARLIEARETCGYSRCGRTDKGVSSAGQVIALQLKSAFALDASWDPDGHDLLESNDLPNNEHESLQVWTVPRSGRDRHAKKRRTVVALSSSDTAKSQKRQPKLLQEYAYAKILNNLLPPSIRILGWTPVSSQFSARFSATQRTYRYFFCARRRRQIMNLETMRQGLQLLVGKHDFRNLCKMDVEHVSNFERVIHAAELVVIRHPNDDNGDHDDNNNNNNHDVDGGPQVCYFEIFGQAFLWHQIRCIVEVLFYIGRGLESPNIISKLLDVQTNPRKPSYPMADEKPLVLHHCGYGKLQLGYSVSNLWTVSCQLEQQWEELTLAAARIRSCIDSLQDVTVLREDLVSFCESKLAGRNKKLQRQCRTATSIAENNAAAVMVTDLMENGDYETSTTTTSLPWKEALNFLHNYHLVPDPQGLHTALHRPLFQRSTGTSYEEKVEALQLNEKRRQRYQESVGKQSGGPTADAKFYLQKQQEGGTGL